MIENDSSNATEETSSLLELIPIEVRFWLTLPVFIPSVIISVILLIHLLSTRKLRHSMHNHVIIILLFLSLLHLIGLVLFSLIFYQLGVVWPASPSFCKFSTYADYGTFSPALIYTAWSSFERHLLVFHDHLFATRLKRFMYHYFPLYGISIYLIVYYIYFMFFYPCETPFDYFSDACGDWPCFLNEKFHRIFHNLAHGMIPILLVVLFSLGLLIRVIIHKRRLNQSFRWKKQRTMIIQLLAIATLYSLTNFPMMSLAVIRQAGFPQFGLRASEVFFFLSSHVMMLLPFLTLRLLPDAWPCFMCLISNLKCYLHETASTLAARILSRNF